MASHCVVINIYFELYNDNSLKIVHLSYYAPARNRRGIKLRFYLTSDVCLSVCLTSVCLSVAYIGPKSRTKA